MEIFLDARHSHQAVPPTDADHRERTLDREGRARCLGPHHQGLGLRPGLVPLNLALAIERQATTEDAADPGPPGVGD